MASRLRALSKVREITGPTLASSRLTATWAYLDPQGAPQAAWLATLQSPDGVHAYELPITATAMLLINGEPRTIIFEETHGGDNE